MTELIGRNVDFNTKNVGKTSKSASSKKEPTIEGNHTITSIAVVKKTDKTTSTKISGDLVDFKVIQQGKWTWEEKKPSFCMICKLPFKPNREVARCPMCQSLFHREHIFEWLKVKGKCPVCQQALRPEGIEEVKL